MSNCNLSRREILLGGLVLGFRSMPTHAFAKSNLNSAITDVPGIKIGHFTHSRRATGCTVVLTESGAVAGVDVRGAAPGTRETDLLDPTNLAETGEASRLHEVRRRDANNAGSKATPHFCS